MRLKALLGAVVASASGLVIASPVLAQQLWQNSYGSPYSSGPSYTDGSSDYHDTSNRYGNRLGGGTIYSEKTNTTYECTSYGTCFKAWDGF